MRRSLIVFTLVLSLLFCCGAVLNTIFIAQNILMEGHNACGMGGMKDQAGSGHTQSIVVSLISFSKDMTAMLSFISLLIVVLTFLINKKTTFYFKQTRDRYGGFMLFFYFVSLFRLGILHPKIF